MEKNEEIKTNEAEKPFTEHLAMEILKNEQKKHKAKDIGIICLTIAVIIITIGLSVINYRNDVDWRRLFSDYDYISQDGSGFNNANYGEQGDLLNGTEDKSKEESEQR